MSSRSVAALLIAVLAPVGLGFGDSLWARRAGPQASAQPQVATGTWQATDGVVYAPWTIRLTQAGTTLTGTVDQNGGMRGPAEIRDGTIQGNTLSFKVLSPSGGRTITFVGTLSGDEIAFTRSIEDPVGIVSGAGIFGVSGATAFTAHRASPGAVAPMRGPSDPVPAGAQRWVAVDGVGFPPWTFVLFIKDGTVTGTASQGRVDPATHTMTSIPGPFQISEGRADGDAISFTLNYDGGARVVTFTGTRAGDQIAFTRNVQVVRGEPGLNGIVGAQGATQFTARLEVGDTSPVVGPVIRSVGSAPAARQPVVSTPVRPRPVPIGFAGAWRVADVPAGPWVFDFTPNGAALAGTIRESAADGVAAVAAGKIDGSAMSFKVLTPDGDRVVEFHGHLEGDQITFTRTVITLPKGGTGRPDLFGAAGPPTFVATRDDPDHLRYKGFIVDVGAAASAPDRETILQTVRAQLDLVDAAKFSVDTRRFLATVQVVVLPAAGALGYRSGQINLPLHADGPPDRDHPLLLHQFLLAYHDLHVPDGFHNAAIEMLFEQARTSQQFAAGSAMLSNVAEYFATMATVYLNGSDGSDPLTRDSIRMKQPEMYRWLVTEFGPR